MLDPDLPSLPQGFARFKSANFGLGFLSLPLAVRTPLSQRFERDIRRHVIKRNISGGTHSYSGRDCRDAFLGLMPHLHQSRHRGLGVSR
jgi:hypothetical protein